MVARLAFVITIDTEPEILLIGEVLEVGDASFMGKSGHRVQEFCHSGSTELLVSHNTDRNRKLCSKVLWLNDGQIKTYGESEEVIEQYIATITGDA
jgi:ABC-type polysaccharide/polyol phosphate transport system ATPase subunit